MTARQLQLAMWYAGHTPWDAMMGAWYLTDIRHPHMVKTMYAQHMTARTGAVNCGA